MKAVSTRGKAPAVNISQAIAAGLAPDGGLYMPVAWPAFAASDFDGAESTADVALRMLAPFFEGDALADALPAICADAFAVEPPLRRFGAANDYVLELFHGPTAAFKDYGAGFLAGCLSALPRGDTPLTIVVATSGDTGAAVAGAFHGREGFRVAIMYPDGRVSPRQAHQLGCFGGNIRAFRVDGSFDDCQALVKRLDGVSAQLGGLMPQIGAAANSVAQAGNTTTAFTQAGVQAMTQVQTRTLPEVDALARNLQQLSSQLGALTENLKANPSQLLYGPALPPPGPGEKP